MRNNLIIIVLALMPVFAQALELTDITSGMFKAQPLEEMTPLPDGERYAMLTDEGMVYAYSYKTGLVTDTLFDIAKGKALQLKEIEGYVLPEQGRYMLVYANSQRIYRHSFTADYYLYDMRKKVLQPLAVKENGDVQPLREPVFSPDGKYIAYTRDNNIFIYKVDFHTEVPVTTDGIVGELYNGAADWLYEEEFGITALYTFSPDSKQLAFVRLDDRQVPTFSWQEYLDEAGQPLRYPTLKSLRYPKAGDANPVATVCVYDTYYKSIKAFDMPEQKDSYYPRLRWTNADEKNPTGQLAILRMNRDQNKMEVFLGNPKSTNTTLLYKEEAKNAWVDYENFDQWQWLSDNSIVLVSEQGGFRSVYLYSAQGMKQRELTPYQYDVTAVYGYDEKAQMLYFQAADQNPMNRSILALNTKKNVLTTLSKGEGMHAATFAATLQYFVDAHQSVKQPTTYTLYDKTGKTVRVLKDNADVKAAALTAGLPTKEFFQFTTERGDVLNGWMLRPADFDAGKKYPVLMMHYSGPASQQVLNRWRIDWEEYLCKEQDMICICVDPRGTNARGREFRTATYMNLGQKEIEDQISAAKYMASQEYVDASRIAIWGWSYGGYATLKTLLESAAVLQPLSSGPAQHVEKRFNLSVHPGLLFRCGIAVAPVTDWRLYDSGYTERYMRRPQVNSFGYDDAALMVKPGKSVPNMLICHGMADDNVHAQNAYLFFEQLTKAGVQYEMHLYPDDNHFLRKRANYAHLYQRMLMFLKSNGMIK